MPTSFAACAAADLHDGVLRVLRVFGDQQQFDLLADGVRAALDMPAIYAAMGMQKGDNT